MGKVEVPKLTDSASWDGTVTFRVPSRIFEFPMPHGSGYPWNLGNAVGTLDPIETFDFNHISVQLLRDKKGHRRLLDRDPPVGDPS